MKTVFFMVVVLVNNSILDMMLMCLVTSQSEDQEPCSQNTLSDH